MTQRTAIIIIDVIGWAFLVLYIGTDNQFKIFSIIAIGLFSIGLGIFFSNYLKKDN